MIVLCGKTASGKDTIMQELINLGFERVVTYTTRPMRNGEENGKSYYFVSEDRFKELENKGFFLETTCYNVANGQTWYYGTPINDLTDDKAIIMNLDGVKVIRQHQELNPVIFYISTNEYTIRTRLLNRGDNLQEAARRIKADNEDFKDIHNYIDCCLVNNGEITPRELAYKIVNIYRKR